MSITTLGELITEAGLTPTISPHCVSGLVGGRDHCQCERCRKRLGLEPLPEIEAQRFAEGARKAAYL